MESFKNFQNSLIVFVEGFIVLLSLLALTVAREIPAEDETSGEAEAVESQFPGMMNPMMYPGMGGMGGMGGMSGMGGMGGMMNPGMMGGMGGMGMQARPANCGCQPVCSPW